MAKKSNEKLINTFIIIGIIFLIGSLALMFIKNGTTDKHLVDISYSEYEKKMEEDEYNIFLLTSPTCSHCVNYKPYVNLVAEENNLVVYNINLDNLEYEQYVAIHDKYNAIKNEYGEGNVPSIPTPVTVITKNGGEVTSIMGDIKESGFRNLLKTYNVIK